SGSYYLYYTFVDGSGHETTVGLSQSGPVTVTTGQAITFPKPTLPPWATAINVYLTPPGGAPGTELFYAQVSAIAAGSTVTVASAPPGSRGAPPAAHGAASHVRVPTLVCYEGGIQNPIPGTVPLQSFLMHDSFLHPSGRDLVKGWYLAVQQGSPVLSGSG